MKQISEFLDIDCLIHLLDVMALNSQILFEPVSRGSSGMDTLKIMKIHVNRGKLEGKKKLVKAAIIQFPFINKSKVAL